MIGREWRWEEFVRSKVVLGESRCRGCCVGPNRVAFVHLSSMTTQTAGIVSVDPHETVKTGTTVRIYGLYCSI